MEKNEYSPVPWNLVGLTTDRNGRWMAEKIESRSSNNIPVAAGECEWEGMLLFDKVEDAYLMEKAPKLFEALLSLVETIEENGTETDEFIGRLNNARFLVDSIMCNPTNS